MEFFTQPFPFNNFYLMFKTVFETIGYDYYKGLKYKLPPIRYLGKNKYNDDMVILAHPHDFIDKINLFREIYKNLSRYNYNKYNLDNKIDEIYEIYPSLFDLQYNPNGFIGLFVNENGLEIVKNEFNKNDEIDSLKFLKITLDGIDTDNIEMSGVLDIFIKKLISNKRYLLKYNNLYLVIGKLKQLNILTGEYNMTNRYNIIGGKRLYNEDSIQSTIREAIEEFGLKEDSKLANIIKVFVPNTREIIRCKTFNIYCIYFTPKNENDYNLYIKNNNYIYNYINNNLINEI